MLCLQGLVHPAFASRRDHMDGSSPLRATQLVQDWLHHPQRVEGLIATASSGHCATFTASVSAASGHAGPPRNHPSDGGFIGALGQHSSEAARMETMHITDVRPLLQPLSGDTGEDEDARLGGDTSHSAVPSLTETDAAGASAGATSSATLTGGVVPQHTNHVAPQVLLISPHHCYITTSASPLQVYLIQAACVAILCCVQFLHVPC